MHQYLLQFLQAFAAAITIAEHFTHFVSPLGISKNIQNGITICPQAHYPLMNLACQQKVMKRSDSHHWSQCLCARAKGLMSICMSLPHNIRNVEYQTLQDVDENLISWVKIDSVSDVTHCPFPIHRQKGGPWKHKALYRGLYIDATDNEDQTIGQMQSSCHVHQQAIGRAITYTSKVIIQYQFNSRLRNLS